MSPRGAPPRPSRLLLAPETAARIEEALQRLGYDLGPARRWRRVARDAVWVLSLHGRVGVCLVELRPGEPALGHGAGWEAGSHWEAPGRPRGTAYAAVFADGTQASSARFVRASAAAEFALRRLRRYEDCPADPAALAYEL